MVSIFDNIIQAGRNNEDIKFTLKSNEFVMPLKLHDAKAVQMIEMLSEDPELADATVADLHEILDFAKFWLEFTQLFAYQDPAKREEFRKSIVSGRNKLD